MTLILVHGTWAKNAPWTHDTAPFTVAFKSKIPRIDAVERIDWSGKNSFSARVAAAEQIATSLDAIPRSGKAIICAHSHGGGAVCYALQRHPDLIERVEALVFLATPFCSYRLLPSWRPLVDGLWSPIVFGFFLIYIVLFIASTLIIAQLTDRTDPLAWLDSTATLLAAIAWLISNELAIGALISLNKLKLRLTHALLRNAIRTGRSVSCELPQGLKAIFIRLSGDEASVTLNFAQGVSWLTIALNVIFNKIFGLLARPFRIVKLRRPIIGRALFALITLWYTISLFVAFGSLDDIRDNVEYYHEYIEFPELILILIFKISAVSLALPLVLFTASLGLFLLNWLLSLIFGRLPFLAGGLLEPAVEATPPGIWSFDHVAWTSYGHSARKLLWRHSNPYSEQKIILNVISWLKR